MKRDDNFCRRFPCLAGLLLAAMVLRAQAAPSNDNFDQSTVIPQVPSSGTLTMHGSNTNATAEYSDPSWPVSGIVGGKSVWWKWTPQSSGLATISTAGSTFDTMLAVYVGPSIDVLTNLAYNDDVLEPPDVTSQLTFNAYAGTTYYILVEGFYNQPANSVASGDISLTISVSPLAAVPPWILDPIFGSTSTQSGELRGKVVMINFWSIYCQPCVDELPNLNTLYGKYRPLGLAMIGPAKDDPDLVADFSISHQIDYPIFRLTEQMTRNVLTNSVGSVSMPSTLLIDRGNNVAFFHDSSVPAYVLEAEIKLLLGIFPPVQAPRLSTKAYGNSVSVAWQDAAFAFVLESASSPKSTHWTPVSPSWTYTNGFYNFSYPVSDPAQFFRLRKP